MGVWGVAPPSCSKACPGPGFACSTIVKGDVRQADQMLRCLAMHVCPSKVNAAQAAVEQLLTFNFTVNILPARGLHDAHCAEARHCDCQTKHIIADVGMATQPHGRSSESPCTRSSAEELILPGLLTAWMHGKRHTAAAAAAHPRRQLLLQGLGSAGCWPTPWRFRPSAVHPVPTYNQQQISYPQTITSVVTEFGAAEATQVQAANSEVQCTLAKTNDVCGRQLTQHDWGLDP